MNHGLHRNFTRWPNARRREKVFRRFCDSVKERFEWGAFVVHD